MSDISIAKRLSGAVTRRARIVALAILALLVVCLFISTLRNQGRNARREPEYTPGALDAISATGAERARRRRIHRSESGDVGRDGVSGLRAVGRVVDVRGEAVRGARVVVAGGDTTSDERSAGGELRCSVTDDDGEFELTLQESAGVTIRILHGRFVPLVAMVEPVVESGARHVVEYVLQDGLQISGSVTAVGLGPLGGVQVCGIRGGRSPAAELILGQDAWTSRGDVRTCRTDADGRFVLCGLDPGFYATYAAIPGMLSSRSAGPGLSGATTARAGTDGVELKVRPAAIVAFEVCDQDSMLPVPSFQRMSVSAIPTDEFALEPVTGGNFALRAGDELLDAVGSPGHGIPRVWIAWAKRWPIREGAEVRIDISAFGYQECQQTIGVHVPWSEGDLRVGKVLLKRSGEFGRVSCRFIDRSGVPISGLTLHVPIGYDDGRFAVGIDCVSDASGTATVGLPVGTYSEVSSGDQASAWGFHAFDVRSRAESPAVFELRESLLRFSVVDGNGDAVFPVEAVTVRHSPGAGPVRFSMVGSRCEGQAESLGRVPGTAQVEGMGELRRTVSGGERSFRVSCPGFRTAEFTRVIVDGEVTQIDVVLNRE